LIEIEKFLNENTKIRIIWILFIKNFSPFNWRILRFQTFFKEIYII